MAESEPRKKDTPQSESKLHVRRTRLMGQINSYSVKEVMKDIDKANEEDEVDEIKMLLGSGGGSIYDGVALYDHILASEKPIDIVAAGNCMSAAVTVLQAGRKRLSYPHTTFMVHPSSFGMERKSFDDAVETFDQYKKLHYSFLDLTLERSGMKREEIESMYNPKKYFTAQEALQMGPNGFIDEIVVFRK
jgi:ATP-dependent Clp protease protease subunit